MRHLALYLRAPLQSWGASSKFGDRGTIDAPTRSGLLGMIAAACGIGWTAMLCMEIPLYLILRHRTKNAAALQ